MGSPQGCRILFHESFSAARAELPSIRSRQSFGSFGGFWFYSTPRPYPALTGPDRGEGHYQADRRFGTANVFPRPARAGQGCGPGVGDWARGGYNLFGREFAGGGCSSTAERLTVAQEVVGSNPITHPTSLCARSSADQSIWLRTRGSGVRIPPGAPGSLTPNSPLIPPKGNAVRRLPGLPARGF